MFLFFDAAKLSYSKETRVVKSIVVEAKTQVTCQPLELGTAVPLPLTQNGFVMWRHSVFREFEFITKVQ